jgi:hypothetical protein
MIMDANEEYARDLGELIRWDEFQESLLLLLGWLDLYSVDTWREDQAASSWLAQNAATNPDAALTTNTLRLFDQLRQLVDGPHWEFDAKGRRVPVWRLTFRSSPS